MSKAIRCVNLHLGKESPIWLFRKEFSEDVEDLVAGGMERDAAWMQVIDAKLLNLGAEKTRIEQSVADAYGKTAAGKVAAPVKAEAPAPISDVGEKIGGSRKDTAVSTGATRRKSDDDRPAWARRFKLSQIVTGIDENGDNTGRWAIYDTKNTDWTGNPKQVGRDTYATKAEAEAVVPIAAVSLKHRPVPTRDGKYEIWRDITDRKRVKVVDRQFDSRDEAMAYMLVNAVEIVETNTTFGEADMPLPPDRARTGPERRTGNVTGEDLEAALGLRGIEFGNWNNQDERQSLMNDAWDGLMDLADVLGVPPKALGLNGDLALAFGARGHGLQSARAHYEPARTVINLTKESGAGSLAHEFFHALDHYFGRQDGKASATWIVQPDGTRTLDVKGGGDEMVSSGFRGERSGVRPELREAYSAMLRTMTKKAETYVEDTAKADKFVGAARENLVEELSKLRSELAEQKDVRYYKRNNKPASAELLAEFDAIAKKMIDGEVSALATDWKTFLKGGDKPAGSRGASIAARWTNDSLEQLSAIYKTVRGRSGFDGTNRSGAMDRLRGNMDRYSQRLKMLAEAQSETGKVRAVPTDFAMNARELDQGRGSDYWTTPHEMAARAFQGYVEDKIAERGGVSRFLNYAPENAAILTPWGFKRPFPAGAERKAINEAMDKFVGELKTRTDDAGNVAMFSRQEGEYTAPDGTAFNLDTSVDGARNIGMLDRGVGRGADSVHPYVARSLRADAPLGRIAEAFGGNVQWFDLRDDLDAAQKRTFGFFNGANLRGTIYLRASGNDRPHLSVLGHEAAHRLKTERPDLYRQLVDAITPYVDVVRYEADFTKSAVAKDVKTAEGIQEEFIGEVLSDGFMDPQFWQALGRVNKTLLQRVASVVFDLIDSIRAKVGYTKRTERYLTDYSRVMDIAGEVMAEFGAKPPASFSRSPGMGISMRDAEAVVATVRKAMPNAPDIVLHETVDKAPEDLLDAIRQEGAEGDVEAVYWNGKIHAFPQHMADPERALFVIGRHEVRHHGMRTRFGDKLDAVLYSMWMGNPSLRTATTAIMDAGRATTKERAKAIEEALADMPVEQIAKLKHFDRLVSAVRQWLRETAVRLRRNGLGTLADAIDPKAWTDNDVAAFVLKAEQVSGKGGTGGAFSRTAPGRGIISTKQIGDQWVVIRNQGTDNEQHLGYFDTEADASERAEQARVEVRRGRQGAVWWVPPRSITLRTTGVGRLDSVDRQRAVQSTLDARSDAAKTVAEGRAAQQDPDRAGFCYQTAAEAAASGVGDMVIGWASFVEDGWHAVVMRGGMVYDATMGRWFEPGVYEAMGFQARKTLTTEEVRDYIARTAGDAPDARNQGLAGNTRFSRATPAAARDEAGRFSRAAPDWITSGNAALQAAAGKISTYAPDKPIAEKAREMASGWKEKLVQGIFDAYAPLKSLSMDAYIAARMTKAADGAFEGLLMYGKPIMGADGGISGDLDGKGFLGTMRELNGEHDRFLMWVAGNRAARLLADGKENLFKPDEIAAMQALNAGSMADGSSRTVAFRKALADFNTYSKSVLDVAEKSGLIDGESRKMWEHDFYVPFYRVNDEAEMSGPSKIKGLVRQKAFERLKGGKEPLGDLMDNTLRNWSHLLSASLSNVAASKSLLAAESAGIAIEAKESDAKEIAKATGKKGHAVYFMDQGLQRWFVVDDAGVLAAVSSLEAPALNGLPLQIMAKFKKYLTVGVTIAPAFKIRNLIRDTLAAPAANEMSYNIAQNLAQGWKGTDTKTSGYAQMLFSGGLMKFGTYLEGDRAENVKRLIAQGVDKSTILDSPNKVRAALGAGWDWWQDFGDRMENVNRTALYEQLIAQGMSQREAAFRARDMMDFSLQGAWAGMRTLNAVIPFLNARAQGLYKLGRAAKEDPKRMGYMVGAVSLASIALLLAYQDDDDWKAREDWDRDGFWWIKIGSTAFRIPKPFELGAMGTIAERSVELVISDEMTGARFAERMKQMVTGTFAINPVPQMFKPMLDLYANKDSFTGRQIETLGMERLSKPERYAPNTSTFARVVGSAGDVTGISPVQVDHMIRAYFGWLGVQAATTVDVITSPLTDTVRPASTLADWSGGFVKDLPLAQSRYLEQFYEQAKTTSEAMADLKRAREAGDLEKAAEIMEDRASDLSKYRLYQRAERQIGELNKRIRVIRYSTSIQSDEKRIRLDDLANQRARIAKLVSARAQAPQ